MAETSFPRFTPSTRESPSYGAALGLKVGNLGELLERLRSGLPSGSFASLQALLAISQKELASYLGLSEATLHRRFRAGQFNAEESERLYRYVEIFERAKELFDDEVKARAWLKRPALALGGETPLDFAKRERGAREVLDMIDRLEHGVLG